MHHTSVVQSRYRYPLLVAAFILLFYVFRQKSPTTPSRFRGASWSSLQHRPTFTVSSPWRSLPTHYPLETLITLPTGRPKNLPRVQHRFTSHDRSESDVAKSAKRRDAVRSAFVRGWTSYRKSAWLADELQPLSGRNLTAFGGWAATLVDSLDTLYIMGLEKEFAEAVAAASSIDFDTIQSGQINLFETTIRYLGGFLGAYDLSGDVRLLQKATELGEMLLKGFDTPSHMPVARWDIAAARASQRQLPNEVTLLAEIGSLCMEFTRLALVTRDARFFDAVDRISRLLEEQQSLTKLPGMWPVFINANTTNFTEHNHFTLGAMCDSTYEYLPKMYALLGGVDDKYKTMFEYAMQTSAEHTLFRPMTPDSGADILVAGAATVEDDEVHYTPRGEHLMCFSGGMFALGGKLIGDEAYVEIGSKLTQGCIWQYKAFPLGIMPESSWMSACPIKETACDWDEDAWLADVVAAQELATDKREQVKRVVDEKYLPRGFTKIDDPRYSLRPEAIESVFYLYRITGRKDLLETAWEMWTSIDTATKTELANAALAEVITKNGAQSKQDRMESFWMAETLKYFYLIFSEPDLISLDEYVLNTEAHPFKQLV